MSQIFSLARQLSARYPWVSNPLIIGAPMRVMTGPALAVAVSRAGGLGFIGPGLKTQDIFKDLEEASALIKQTKLHQKNKATPSQTLPVGIGFQVWADDLQTATSAIAKYKPCAAWLFAPRNGQPDLDTWSQNIRTASPDTHIWIQIGTVSEVRAILASTEKPDVIVVQGAEAGGHGRANDGIGLISLLPEVADLLAAHDAHIPLVAAGGIVDGRGAAAALALGASGVAMGTRFLASHEARIARGYQNEILRASEGGAHTTRTQLYNHLRGTFGWPEAYSPRTIINASFVEHQAGRTFEELKVDHDEAVKRGDDGWGPQGRLATYAGASIGLVREVKGAEGIVGEVRGYVEGVFGEGKQDGKTRL
ncbi:inosine monophosphate dehydrogenase [Aspergillus heterothallicus]